MSKELEALERLKNALTFMGGTVEYQACTNSETLLLQDYEIVKQALLELKSIKEANHSEALECLEEIGFAPLNECCGYPYTRISDEYNENIETIQQALLNAEQEHKALEIIKEKYPDVVEVKLCKDYDHYKLRMSSKHYTEIVKIDWNDKSLLTIYYFLPKKNSTYLKRC